MHADFVIGIVTFCLLMIAVAAVAVRSLQRTWRAARRVRQVERVGQGRCPQCNYDIAGRLPDSCIECGYVFSASERRRLEGIYVGLTRMRERGTRR